jgi:Spy/CpxP family protein refolding chaperone
MKQFAFVLAALAAVAICSPAMAQRGGGRGFGGGRMAGGNLLGLLGQKPVQEDLKLSDDQVKKVDEQVEKQREVFAALRDLSPEERQKEAASQAEATKKNLAEILKDDQLKRLKQISLQQRGGQALADPEVSSALNLTSEQKDRIAAIQEGVQSEMRELFQAGAAGGDREALQKKGQELRAATDQKILAVLTDTQQAKLKEMKGEPFKGELLGPGRARGGRPGRGA